MVKTSSRHRITDDIPECIFPKGIKAGIKCSSLKVLWMGGRQLRICNESMCCYHEAPISDQDESQVVVPI